MCVHDEALYKSTFTFTFTADNLLLLSHRFTSVSTYRKILNTIRAIFTKNRGLAAGVRIIHLN